MPPYTKQLKSYERLPQIGSPRQTESWALIEAAKRLAQAITSGDVKDKESRLMRKNSLRLNWRLWTIFQADLTQEGRDDVPLEVLQNMLTLCQFVDKHTVGALVEPSDEKLSVLIDINRNIAAGLMGSPEDGTPMQEQAEPEKEDPPPTPSVETKA
mgnify:CR=1 FL=1